MENIFLDFSLFLCYNSIIKQRREGDDTTGDEIRAARAGCGLSRDELGALLGVAGQVIGSWERQGPNQITAARKREAIATRTAKQKLQGVMNFMSAIATFKSAMNTGDMIPAPCDWQPIFQKGDPLILSGEDAVEGDLVLLRDDSRDFTVVARVLAERENGKLMCFTRPYKVQELPWPEDYKTIEYNLSRQHDGVPDRIIRDNLVQPDLI